MRLEFSKFTMQALKALIFSALSFAPNAYAQNWPRLHEIKCQDKKAIAKEAVAYALVGAWAPFTTHACFEGETFKYFHPGAGKPIGEVTNLDHVTQFVRGRDKYAIRAVRSEGKESRIDVEFKINGRKFTTTYEYVPNPEYTATTGICGFVVNPVHDIIRSDCIDKRAWNNFKQILDARKQTPSSRMPAGVK
jgi:hypothetical protein